MAQKWGGKTLIQINCSTGHEVELIEECGPTPRLQWFFDVLDTVPALRDRPKAIDPGALRVRVEFEGVFFSHARKRPRSPTWPSWSHPVRPSPS
jgi:hypothetical protein